MGQRTSVTIPGNRTVYYEFHLTGELKKVYGAGTYTRSYLYDSQGHRQSLTTYSDNNTPQNTSWSYNSRGFMTAKTYPDGKSIAYTYTPSGQLLTRTWARGITTTYGYDNADRQTSISYSDNTPTISYVYDYLNRPTSVSDSSGTHLFTYNADSSLDSVTVPHILNHKLEYSYDTLGRRTAMNLKNTSTGSNDVSALYSYDSMSRIATVGDGINTATYTTVTGTNMLDNTVISNASGNILATDITYDSFRRLTSTVSTPTGQPAKAYSYIYNDKDQRTQITLPDGSYWVYSYDDKGQVIGAVKHDPPAAGSNPPTGATRPGQFYGYNYDDIGNRLWEQRGIADLKIDYTPNSLNQYSKLATPGVAPVTGEADTAATVKAIRTDILDPAVESVIIPTRSGKYFAGAFHGVNNANAAKTVNYTVYALKDDPNDSTKQLIRKEDSSYTVPKRDKTFTYDDDGNLLNDGKYTYTWNAENRLISIQSINMGTDAQKLEFAYDYMGRRTNKKVYNWDINTTSWTLATDTYFVYNGYKQIASYLIDSSPFVTHNSYLWQPVGQDVPLWTTEHTNNNAVYFYIADGNKNIRAMVDTAGNEVAAYDYTPFGKVSTSSGTYATTNQFRFSSEYHDNETDLVYYNYRYYSPELGRWISRDPIEEVGGNNLYGMIGNNAVNKWDYIGMSFLDNVLKNVKNKEWEIEPRSKIDAMRDMVKMVKTFPKAISTMKSILYDESIKQSYIDDMGKKMIQHYIYGDKTLFEIPTEYMIEMATGKKANEGLSAGYVDIRTKKRFKISQKWIKALKLHRVTKKNIDYSGSLATAWANGAIGNYTVKFVGEIIDDKWCGEVKFIDEFNLDPDWTWKEGKNKRSSVGEQNKRSSIGERRTRIGYILNIGEDYKIETKWHYATQQSYDNHITIGSPVKGNNHE